jgi:hypothetical protein
MQIGFSMLKKKKIKGSDNLPTNLLNMYPTCFLFKLKEKGNKKKERKYGHKSTLSLMLILIKNKLRHYGSCWKSFRMCLRGTRES